MKWKQLVTPVDSLTPDEVKTYMAEHDEGTYTLLDVRQEGEYEQSRIAGSTLIPLPELADRLEELDHKKPVIAYCAVGGRSRAAAQLLSGKGFTDVFNLNGGINAWNGQTAGGPADFGMHFISGEESAEEIIVLAYGMEVGMWIFYETIKDHMTDVSAQTLLAQLAGIEDKHKEKLFTLYSSLTDFKENLDQFEAKIVSTVMESGVSTDEFIEHHLTDANDVSGILNVAMALETHAFDLYSRYSQKVADKETKNVLYQVAQEEKKHLQSLGGLMDKHG